MDYVELRVLALWGEFRSGFSSSPVLFAADVLPQSVPFVLFHRQRGLLLIQHWHRVTGKSCHVSVWWKAESELPGKCFCWVFFTLGFSTLKGSRAIVRSSSPSEIFKEPLLLMVTLLKAQIFSAAIVTDAVGEMKQVEIPLPEFEGSGVLSLFLWLTFSADTWPFSSECKIICGVSFFYHFCHCHFWLITVSKQRTVFRNNILFIKVMSSFHSTDALRLISTLLGSQFVSATVLCRDSEKTKTLSDFDKPRQWESSFPVYGWLNIFWSVFFQQKVFLSNRICMGKNLLKRQRCSAFARKKMYLILIFNKWIQIWQG